MVEKICLDSTSRKTIIVVAGPVAQLDRVPDFESEGQEFESLRGHHFLCMFIMLSVLIYENVAS